MQVLWVPVQNSKEMAVAKVGKAGALHLAPGDGPDRIVNARSTFLPKAKQLGNTTSTKGAPQYVGFPQGWAPPSCP